MHVHAGFRYIDADGNADLRFDSILGGSIKSFDPLEKQFDAPVPKEK